MELRAAIAGLAALKSPSLNVELVTDSQYVIGALNGNRARKNKELIARLKQLAGKLSVITRHVRGHTGHELNDYVDDLARSEANKLKELLSAKTRVIVFGSRSFDNYQLLAHKLNCILSRFTDVAIISGGAAGPDQLGPNLLAKSAAIRQPTWSRSHRTSCRVGYSRQTSWILAQ